MLRKIALSAITTTAALHLAPLAQASDYPFYLKNVSDLDDFYFVCHGPALRSTGCVSLNNIDQKRPFYIAIDTLFSAVGIWSCRVYADACLVFYQSRLEFCGPGAGSSPRSVEFDLQDYHNIKVNQAESCEGTVVNSELGQNGEADDTPARDVDTYRFAGKSGERVAVTLSRGGSTGSLGAVATLRLRAKSGAVIEERTGEVPLTLAATLAGEVEVVVLRDGKGGNALRGGYELELKSAAGALGGRGLRPTENVEG
jgi:hypothetical protein